jgi:hypothetical protein
MLFMVMSNPRPERPSDIRDGQTGFWDWLEPLKRRGICKACYVKVGRGLFMVLEVDTHETLHRYLTEWANRVPAEFRVDPLIDPAHQERIARRERGSVQTA